MHTYMANEEYR